MLQLVEDGGIYANPERTALATSLASTCRHPFTSSIFHSSPLGFLPCAVGKGAHRQAQQESHTSPASWGSRWDGQTGVEGWGGMRQAWKDGEEAQGGSHAGASGGVAGRWRVE